MRSSSSSAPLDCSHTTLPTTQPSTAYFISISSHGFVCRPHRWPLHCTRVPARANWCGFDAVSHFILTSFKVALPLSCAQAGARTFREKGTSSAEHGSSMTVPRLVSLTVCLNDGAKTPLSLFDCTGHASTPLCNPTRRKQSQRLSTRLPRSQLEGRRHSAAAGRAARSRTAMGRMRSTTRRVAKFRTKLLT